MTFDVKRLESSIPRRLFRFLVNRPGVANPLLAHAVSKRTAVRLGHSIFILGHQQVVDVLSRDKEFTLAQLNRTRIPTGDFLLSMDDGTTYQQEKARILDALGCPLWDGQPLAKAVADEVKTLTSGILDHAANPDCIDFCADLAEIVSTKILLRFFIGIEPCDAVVTKTTQNLTHLARLLVLGDSAPVELVEASAGIADEVKNMVGERLDNLAAQPISADDLTSQLFNAAANNGQLTEIQRKAIISMVAGLCLGGCVNVSTTAARAMNQLLSRPDIMQKAIMAAHSSRAGHMRRYILEVLRFNTMFPVLPRFCISDSKIDSGDGGHIQVKAGDTVLLVLQAAMQDERVVASPTQIILDRPMSHYLHFGAGIHKCLGEELSMVQVTTMISEVLKKEPYPYHLMKDRQTGVKCLDSWPAARQLTVLLGRPTDRRMP